MNAVARNLSCIVAAAGAAVLATAIVAVPISQAATQAGTTEVSSVSVHVGDLDARTIGGAQHVYSRLQRAAQQVCGDDSGTGMDLELANVVRSCEQQAIEPAVDRIHTAPLTAIYIRHFPERRGTVAVEPDAQG